MGSYAGAMPEESERWAVVAYVLSMSSPVRPVLHLGDFATERSRRIGFAGLVVPPGEVPSETVPTPTPWPVLGGP